MRQASTSVLGIPVGIFTGKMFSRPCETKFKKISLYCNLNSLQKLVRESNKFHYFFFHKCYVILVLEY